MNDQLKEIKKKVQDQIYAEYQAFKSEILKLSAEEVYNHNYEIHVKIELAEVILQDCITDYIYESLVLFGEGLLQYLYNDFLNTEYASVNTFEETEQFILDSMDYWLETSNGGDCDGNV